MGMRNVYQLPPPAARVTALGRRCARLICALQNFWEASLSRYTLSGGTWARAARMHACAPVCTRLGCM